MQPVCHSERSAAKSKNLRTCSYVCSEIGAKILRLPSVAQDDTTISAGLHMQADTLNLNLSNRPHELARWRNEENRHMTIEQINNRYIDLCKEYDISITVSNIDTADAPKYESSSNDEVHHIVLNTAKIDHSMYAAFLAYAVSVLLLPRLVLKTERLLIRRFAMRDAAECFAFMSDEQGMFLDGCKPFYTMDDDYRERMQLFEEREGQYVIVLRNTNEVIGTINVFSDDSRAVSSKEIGYAISPKHQRKGYAYEAITAITNLLQQDLLFDMVVAGVLPENIPSIKLLEKLGFCKEGIRHKALWHEGLDKPVDLVYYYLDRNDP